jgi:hypothetical protein
VGLIEALGAAGSFPVSVVSQLAGPLQSLGTLGSDGQLARGFEGRLGGLPIFVGGA